MGQSKHISKHKRKELLAERLQKNAAFATALKQSKKRFKKFDEVIEDEFYRRSTQDYNDERIHTLRYYFRISKAKKHSETTLLFKNALQYLVKIRSAIIKHDALIKAVYNLCQYKYSWKNDFFNWKPTSNNAENQIKELAFYLVCKFPVPTFFYQVWFDASQRDYIPWFIKLGQGFGVKTFLNLPIEMTKKMRFHFLFAPDKFTVFEAIRFAQVKGMGGDDNLAKAIVASRLGFNNFENDEFWSRFIQILISGGMFNLDKIGELVDYLREQLRQDACYSLKGRTLQSLLRQSDTWHQVLSRTKTSLATKWLPSRINEFAHVRKKKDDEIAYYIIELLNAKNLMQEGRKMGHCVGSYATYCLRGRTSIFSMRKYVNGIEEERMATIEIHLSDKRIVQAKAKHNQPISSKAKEIMELWMQAENLQKSKHL